uniref:SFRICE_040608 n=1 Tax=Spodoptera frugiperda TaxID=7108 RepID=A0A2H1X3B6_SPOFR
MELVFQRPDKTTAQRPYYKFVLRLTRLKQDRVRRSDSPALMIQPIRVPNALSLCFRLALVTKTL